MGIVIKQAVRSTIYSYLGAFLGFLTVWFMNRLWLTSEQNGLLNLLISISLVTGSLSNLGMAGVTTRMFPHFRDSAKKHNGFLFYPLIITVAGFMLFLLIFFLTKDDVVARNIEKSRLFADNIYYLLPLTFFIALFYILDAYSRSIYLTTAGVIVKEVLLRIVILIAAFAYHKDWISFDHFVLIYCASFCAMAAGMAIFLASQNEFHVGRVKNYLTPSMKREMRQVAYFSVITGLSSLLISSIDKIIVNDKLGLAPAGVFAVATYFGSIIQIPGRSIVRITSSVIADSWKKNDLANIKSVYHKSCLNQLIVGALLLMVIWVNIDGILSLMPPEYDEAKYVIIFMALGYLADMATGVNGVIIGTSKYFRYDTYFMLLLVIFTVITNLLLIPVYGITGAAIASCLTYVLYNFLRFLFIWMRFGFQPYNIDFLKALIIAFISLAAGYFLPKVDNIYLDMMMRGSVISILYGGLIYASGIAPDINQTIHQLIRRKNQ